MLIESIKHQNCISVSKLTKTILLSLKNDAMTVSVAADGWFWIRYFKTVNDK